MQTKLESNPNPFEVFDSVRVELRDLKHTYDHELRLLEQERTMMENELAQLQRQQKKLISQNNNTRRAREQELEQLEQAFRAAKEKILNQMHIEAEQFAELATRTDQQIGDVEGALGRNYKKQVKIAKKKELVDDRQRHIDQLTCEYKHNAAQLAHEYATAAVDRAGLDNGRKSLKHFYSPGKR